MFNVWINDGTTPMPEDDIFYIVSKEGIFLKKKLGLFESMAKVDKISILNKMESYAALDIKKIPKGDFGKVLGVMRAIYEKYHSEMNTILHYNPERRQFRIEVPEQEVSHGGVDYESDLTYDGYLRIGTIHSHCDFGAFHSGTDKDDEETWDGIHITVGHVNSDHLTITASIVANGSRFWVDPMDYISGIDMVEVTVSQYAHTSKQEIRYVFKGTENHLQFPKAWLENVKKKTYRYVGNNRGRYGFGHIFGSGLFDGVGNTVFDPTQIPKLGQSYTDMVKGFDEEEFNPCAMCPYKGYKAEMLMQELLEDADDEDLDRLGFTEISDDDGSGLDEHDNQEGFRK